MDAGKNSVKLPDLEDADIKKLNTDKELTIGSEGRYQYIYPGSKDAVGYFTYTYKIVRGNADEHLANSVGEKVEEYQLTVTYHPYSKEVRKQKLAKIKEPDEEVYTAENAPKPDLVEQPKGGISVDSSVASTGTYTVKVIAGELQIVKNWMHKLRRKKHLDSQLQTKWRCCNCNCKDCKRRKRSNCSI